jgi:SOS response regulatory protein OraA/RecX
VAPETDVEKPSAAWIEEVALKLLATGARTFTLDEVGEALGERAVGSEEVETLLQRLESEGAQVDSAVSDSLAPLLQKVIRYARELRAQGHAPNPRLIAERGGLSMREVRVALLYFDVIKLG